MEEINLSDNFADPTKVQRETAEKLKELREKQAHETAEKRRRFNEEITESRKRHLKEREEREEVAAKKLAESKKSKRKERGKEYLKSRKELNQKNPNAKNMDLSKLRDQMNPNSKYRGAGRVLQWTGTDKLANNFINTVQGNYSDVDIYSNSDLERDELLTNGFLPEVSLLEDVEKGIRTKDRFYVEALERILDFKKSKIKEVPKEDKTYSAWNLLSRFCESEINNIDNKNK